MGLGEDALYWEQSWHEFPPIDSLNLLANIKNTLINMWGHHVRDYKHIINNDQHVGWNWKSIEETNRALKVAENAICDFQKKKSRKKESI